MPLRKPAAMPPAFDPLDPTQIPGICTHCYVVTLVTPMYGGGVQAGIADKEMPVRVSSIRGQLRFWWRLLNGHGKSSRELFREERALWGGLGDTPEQVMASRVQLAVSHAPAFKERPCASFKKHNDGRYGAMPQFGDLPGYALFPGQGKLAAGGKSIETPPAQLVDSGLKIVLSVLLHGSEAEFEQRVLPALRYWASFGGLGARTRRGLGSLRVEGLTPVTVEEAATCRMRLVLRKSGGKDAVSVWNIAVSRLQQFRQGKNIGRNPGQNPMRPGRSRWPEADAVRRATSTHAPVHAPAHPAGNVFPRAKFGLPIIFHFKDDKAGDPGDTALAPQDSDRFASPLILKAYWDGKEFRAAALLLPTADALCERSLELANSGKGKSLPAPETYAAQAWWPGPHKSADIPPLRDNGGGDPLNAFLTFFVKD